MAFVVQWPAEKEQLNVFAKERINVLSANSISSLTLFWLPATSHFYFLRGPVWEKCKRERKIFLLFEYSIALLIEIHIFRPYTTFVLYFWPIWNLVPLSRPGYSITRFWWIIFVLCFEIDNKYSFQRKKPNFLHEIYWLRWKWRLFIHLFLCWCMLHYASIRNSEWNLRLLPPPFFLDGQNVAHLKNVVWA